ncbi:hypothetical protein B566_EDAN017352 [Ephemera danica]|nr:hypothetical protein B566_EDAN017352 [Ephemera danica]
MNAANDGANINNNGNLPPERMLRDRLELLELSDRKLLRQYRFPRAMIIELINRLTPSMERAREDSIPVATQVLGCLRLLASGSFQEVIGDVVGVSQASMSRILHSFLNAMLPYREEYIFLPLENDYWVRRTKTQFREKANIGGVLGAIDGSQICIKQPHVDGETYINRKGLPAINVQIVADMQRIIRDIVAMYPGSTHDCFIYNNCGLKARLAEWDGQGFLVGDSGYGLDMRVLTPLRQPANMQEENYNVALSRTRIVVEHVNGLLKMEFRILDKSGGFMQYDPLTCCHIIVVCAMLHNKRRMHNLELADDEVGLNNGADNSDSDSSDTSSSSSDDDDDAPLSAIQMRQRIIQSFPADHSI